MCIHLAPPFVDRISLIYDCCSLRPDEFRSSSYVRHCRYTSATKGILSTTSKLKPMENYNEMFGIWSDNPLMCILRSKLLIDVSSHSNKHIYVSLLFLPFFFLFSLGSSHFLTNSPCR